MWPLIQVCNFDDRVTSSCPTRNTSSMPQHLELNSRLKHFKHRTADGFWPMRNKYMSLSRVRAQNSPFHYLSLPPSLPPLCPSLCLCLCITHTHTPTHTCWPSPPLRSLCSSVGGEVGVTLGRDEGLDSEEHAEGEGQFERGKQDTSEVTWSIASRCF